MTQTMNPNTVEDIKAFFEAAVPEPTKQNITTQIGVHFEEVAEMMLEIFSNIAYNAAGLEDIREGVENLASGLKEGKLNQIEIPRRKEMLDALCDQIVTAIGCAHMLNMDIVGALKEVQRSNDSKKVNGEFIFDENQKIKKGPDYTPPDLSPFV